VAERTIIVDGYNVILRTPALRPEGGRSLRESREKLLNLLSWMMGGAPARFIVVFDGDEVVGRDERQGRVEVRYSRPPRTADDLIRDLVEELVERDARTTVVTSDLAVARHARAMGADIALADLFLASALGPPPGVEGEKPAGLSKKELEAWAELFRNRPPDDDAEES
jgi:predicted RNA-binding protein with PIN domain